MPRSEDSSRGPAHSAAPVVDPAALTVEQLAAMLGVAAGKVQEHIAAGAPTSADGTINLVHYAAWLNFQLTGPESGEGASDDGD